MLKLSWLDVRSGDQTCLLLFGAGLIGQSIRQSIKKFAGHVEEQPLSWTWPIPTLAERVCLVDAAVATFGRAPSARFIAIWAAGGSGFGSSEHTMRAEYHALTHVVDVVNSIAEHVPLDKRSFVLLSSAGGLFEGQVSCDASTHPSSRRPYGDGKIDQEEYVTLQSDLGQRLILRPSSVYGYVPGGRLGLVSALISAAKQHRVASIFGALDTLRDYVFAPDIGRYISAQVFAPSPQLSDVRTVLLASGRPASVFEIIRTVEDVVKTPLYLNIEANPENALNNTFKPSALPPGFFPTPLRQGIEQTKSAMEAHTFG